MRQPYSNTIQQQSSLASYCRSGNYTPIPGAREGHIKYYRKLVYNIVDDMLQSAYPLTFDFLDSTEWDQLVQQFLSTHACASPQVWQMPREFYEYIKANKGALHEKYPFLVDLLYFEWLELELFMMEDKPIAFTPIGNPSKDKLQLTQEYTLKKFDYPVHEKPAKHITASDKGEYYLVLFRHPDSGEIEFMQLSAALVLIIERLASSPANLTTLTQNLCKRLQITDAKNVSDSITPFLQYGLEKKLILGYKLDQQ